MNFKRALIVYRKEMLEMLRDKRTIFSTILLPVIMYPLIFVGFSSIMMRQTAKLEDKTTTLAMHDMVNEDNTRLIKDELGKIENFRFVPWSAQTQSQYKNKAINAIVTLSDSLTPSKVVVSRISIQYDKSTDEGRMIYNKLSKALQKTETEILRRRLQVAGLNPDIITTVKIVEQDTSTSQKKLGDLLGKILPYLLITLLIGGAAVVASDLVAGEKERKTLETLLVSSAHRNEIVLGKYLTVISFAMLNVVINLASLYFSMKSVASQSGLQMAGVHFPANGFLMLFVAFVPLASLYAAILLSISAFSRNMKEARSYEQPILIVSMLTAMASWLPGFQINNSLALIPIINVSLLFKAIMVGDYQLSHLLITIGSTLILDVVAIIICIRLFNSESVLFRSDADTSLKSTAKNKNLFFSPYYGMVYYLAALAALYYIGGKLQSANLAQGLMQTQIFIILLPVIIILRLIRTDYRKVIRMNSSSPLNFLVVPFIAISAGILVTLLSQLINMIYPYPEEYLRKLGGLLSMPNLKLWQMYLIIAIMPGICEEIMFRGFLIRFFESQGRWMAIGISAFLFALFHLDPYRFIPVLLLGFLLGHLLLKSNSIFVSMFSHAINNALALSFSQFSAVPMLKLMLLDKDSLQWWLAAPAALVLITSLMLFNRINSEVKTDTFISGGN